MKGERRKEGRNKQRKICTNQKKAVLLQHETEIDMYIKIDKDF